MGQPKSIGAAITRNPACMYESERTKPKTLNYQKTLFDMFKKDNIAGGQNNVQSSDMIKYICHLIGHKFSRFQASPGDFVNKKVKIV